MRLPRQVFNATNILDFFSEIVLVDIHSLINAPQLGQSGERYEAKFTVKSGCFTAKEMKLGDKDIESELGALRGNRPMWNLRHFILRDRAEYPNFADHLANNELLVRFERLFIRLWLEELEYRFGAPDPETIWLTITVDLTDIDIDDWLKTVVETLNQPLDLPVIPGMR